MRNNYQCETYSLPERYTVVTTFEDVQISPTSSIWVLSKKPVFTTELTLFLADDPESKPIAE